MRQRDDEDDRQYAWIVYAVAFLVAGGLMGYVISAMDSRPASGSSAASAATRQAPAPQLTESTLNAYRDLLARDPGNVQAAVSAGNWLYDAQRYVEAIPFYQQAFALNPSDINVSTDLGTALWYAGRADEALAQYRRSLALNGTHAQTLFNVGIVKAEGKRDYPGAITAWEQLLAANPTYASASIVRDKIADARRSADVKP